MTPTAADRGREVRRKLLTAAVELIPERGWNAVSTRLLAERAGVAAGLVHYHFPSLGRSPRGLPRRSRELARRARSGRCSADRSRARRRHRRCDAAPGAQSRPDLAHGVPGAATDPRPGQTESMGEQNGAGEMRAVICGAGIAGLALAQRLASYGWDVTVIEAASGPRT